MEIEVGCVVSYATGKSGVVRFVGETDFAAGEWVGLELERPDGKNNGELNGRVYFTCAPNHGLFCKKAQIKAVLSRPHSAGSGTGAPGASSRLSMSAASASRLQQMRDRRASTVGSAGSHLRAPSSGPSSITRPSSGSFSRSSSSVTTPPSSAGSAAAPPSAHSAIKRPGSASRMSLDMGARRPSLSRAPSVSGLSASDEQLADARAKIAKLEQELEQKNRNVEQLKQSLAVVREAAAAAREAKAEEEAAAAAAAVAAAHDDQAPPATDDDDDDDAMADDAPANANEDEPMDVDTDSAKEDAAAAKEAELLAMIESVKREADELVRNVRAEYEEHIAALVREHETQSDDLRLENATQASEIKALESELAQQKLRIAQFSAAEQKKADEVAHALAKQSTGARKVEALEAQISELHDMIESLTLEKESLEMDKEIAEENAEECLAEIEKLKASLALAAAAAATAPEPTASASAANQVATEELTEENRKLRAAVKALHERASEEKTELNKKLRVAQREHTELLGLREEVEQLTTKRTKFEAEVEELKEQLDLASAYESLIEELTEKNLTLDETNAELRQELREHEEMKEVHEDMEHHHAEYEEELRAEIDAKHASIQDLKQRLAELKTVIDDKDRTIDRFRDLTQTHRDEIHQLKAQLRAETGELETLKGTAHSALNQTLSLRALAAAAREHEAEAAKQRIHAEQANVENAFFRAIIPSSILSDLDQKMLRVRLRLGRVAGKADILVQYVRKDLDAALQTPQSQAPLTDPTKDASSTSTSATGSGNLLDSARSIQQLLLGEKLAAVSCQAQEDLFLLECHLTTEDEFAHACALLDTPSVGVLEAALDNGLAAFADGTLLASRGAGEATVYDRLVSTLDEWRASRAATASAAAEGFPLRCAVVKLHARKSVLSLACSLAVMLTFARSVRLFLASPENDAREDLRTQLLPVVDKLIDGLTALVATSQHFYRRAEIDLAPSDEDLDGVVAIGGDVVELIDAYAVESQSLWVLVEDELSFSRLQDAPVESLVAAATDSLVTLVAALNDKIASLFKSVCRGAFTDAVAPRTRDRSSHDAPDGRPQWRIRAQAIHSELLHASTLRGSLNELSDVCQALQARIRELERSDSQYRVVTQKLESEVLRLTDVITQAGSDKAQLEAQLTHEREQFAATLDESHKERASLDALNRELRKQLKRSSDAGAAAASASSASSSSRNKTVSALSHGDAEAFRQAFAHLHRELRHVRSVLATERLDRVLGPSASPAPPAATSGRLQTSLKHVATFAAHVKAQMAMPRLVDLSQSATASPHSQLVATALAQTKSREAFAALRAHVSAAMRDDGWSDDIVHAIERGESVFGWQPPEMERPAVLRSRVTLRTAVDWQGTGAALPVVPLLLNRSDVAQLSHALVC